MSVEEQKENRLWESFEENGEHVGRLTINGREHTRYYFKSAEDAKAWADLHRESDALWEQFGYEANQGVGKPIRDQIDAKRAMQNRLRNKDRENRRRKCFCFSEERVSSILPRCWLV